MGGPRIRPELVEQVRQMKAVKLADHVIAHKLGLTMNQVLHIRATYGIGGRYAAYQQQLND